MNDVESDYNTETRRFTVTCPNCQCGLMVYVNHYREVELNVLLDQMDKEIDKK